jgi:transcriptional regulator with XRE-family HTH domain
MAKSNVRDFHEAKRRKNGKTGKTRKGGGSIGVNGSRDSEPSTLMYWLATKAADEGLDNQQLAQVLGVTYGYLAQLRSGVRSVTHISRQFARSCAEFLGIAPVSVYIAAGALKKEDFFADSEGLEEKLNRAISYMRNDRTSGFVVPMSLEHADVDTKFLVINLYENVSQQILIPDRADVALLLDHCDV